jgi:hypothetical protein
MRIHRVAPWALLLAVKLQPIPAIADATAKHPGTALRRVADRGRTRSYEAFRNPSTTPLVASGEAAGSSVCNQPAGNCQPQNQFDALTSDRANLVVADDFSSTVFGNVTEVCWWGAYLNAGGFDCQGVSPDAFEVRYYFDANGIPGPLVASFSQSSGTLTVNGPVATGFLIADSVPEYAFTAQHAGVAIIGGGRYWIEISNAIGGCTWFWEVGRPSNERAVQDGVADPIPQPPNGYDDGDVIVNDLAFCLNLPLPSLPSHDACSASLPLSDVGQFPFDNSYATTDGGAHAACLSSRETQIEHDLWYCWTAPCTDTVFIRTCGMTEVDTRIAVYQGCFCPATAANILACNDDLCGAPSGYQSMVTFSGTAGQSYLIRLGTFPGSLGGAGAFEITCGQPEHPQCPGVGSCCTATGNVGCADEACCETVCACDPFCCTTEWDDDCATIGFFGTGCGAAGLCGCSGVCGDPNTGNCCEDNTTPGCSDAVCCEAVCACDPDCCNVRWDVYCATTGFQVDCGAAILCPALCAPQCPVGPITWEDPPDGAVDARSPHHPNIAAQLRGIKKLVVSAPAGAERADCWTLCETADGGSPNSITAVTANGDGTFTIDLARPITAGAVTRVSYTDDNGGVQTGKFVSHPGNADGIGAANTVDIVALVNALGGAILLPWDGLGEDINHSALFTAADILEAIDLLNGAGAYVTWDGTPLPTATGTCP